MYPHILSTIDNAGVNIFVIVSGTPTPVFVITNIFNPYKTIIFNNNGNNEFTNAVTAGGTVSGNFNCHPRISTNLVISTVTKPIIIATNKPSAPKYEVLIAPSILGAHIIKNIAVAISPDIADFILYSPAKQ